MSKYTIELTGMNFFVRMMCCFCGRSERNTFYELMEDGNRTGFLMCESCFQKAKKDVGVLFQDAIRKLEERVKNIESDIATLTEISNQNVQILGRHTLRHDLRVHQKEIHEAESKYGKFVFCKSRCGNCDGNPGDRHLPGCAEMHGYAEMNK